MNNDTRYFHYYFHEEKQQYIKVFYERIEDAAILKINLDEEDIKQYSIQKFANRADYKESYLKFHFDFFKQLNANTYLVQKKDKNRPEIHPYHSVLNIGTVYRKGDDYFQNTSRQVIVYYKKEAFLDEILDIIDQTEGTYTPYSIGNVLLVQYKTTKLAEDGAKQLQRNDICYAQPNTSAISMSSDLLLDIEGLDYSDARLSIENNELYAICNTLHSDGVMGDSAVKIAIVDDGVCKHKSLHNAIDDNSSFDFYANTQQQRLYFNDWHGTACAGIIAATKTDSTGMYGVAAGCSISALKFKKGSGANVWKLAQAFLHCLEKNVSVINCSFDFPENLEQSQVLKEIMRKVARDGRNGRGISIVFSAGNTGHEIQDIKKIKELLVVAAVNKDKKPRDDSSYGNNVFISAMGEEVLTVDYPGNNKKDILTFTNPRHDDFGYFSCTSAAAPIIAGAIGLLLSQNVQLTVDQIKDKLKEAVHPVFAGRKYGAGVFDLQKLIDNF